MPPHRQCFNVSGNLAIKMTIEHSPAMRILFLLTLVVSFTQRIHCQVNSVGIIDTSALSVDINLSGLSCFEYSDTVHTKNQFTTRELRFFFSKRKNPDTLKVIEVFRDSGAFYSPIETQYYYVKGKPIKMAISRTNPVNEQTQTNIYFLNKLEIIKGAELPDSPGWSHTQSSKHMFKVYKRFIKNNSDQLLPGCR